MITIKQLIDEQRKIDDTLFPGIKETVPYSYWGCALAGEIGEVANLFKKIARGHSRDKNTGVIQLIPDEAADSFIYLLLFSDILNREISESRIEKTVQSSQPLWNKLNLTEKGCLLAKDVGYISEIILDIKTNQKQKIEKIHEKLIILASYLFLLSTEMKFNLLEKVYEKQQLNWKRFKKIE